MNGITGSDWAILAMAAYVAVVALVRLMLARRNMLVERLRVEMEVQERHRRELEKRKQSIEKERSRLAGRKSDAA